MTRNHRNRLLIASLLAVSLSLSCAPRLKGATENSFHVSGRADINVSVKEPLLLAASGALMVGVSSDSMPNPTANMTYAVFNDPRDGDLPSRHVHTIFAELQRDHWRWDLETWALPDALSYQKMKGAGKNWTVQILVVDAGKDWFSELYRVNGRQVPDIWLARRWSSTPEDELRIVAEYREPAPACILSHFAESRSAGLSGPRSLSARLMMSECGAAVGEFSRRADDSLSFEVMPQIVGETVQRSKQRPDFAPNMAKLAGTAQKADRGSDDYKR